jgi:hypothetical protein
MSEDFGIKINMTAKEGKSVTLLPLPSGQYHVAVSDCDIQEVSQGDNEGKPMYNLELTVQDGDYENRKVWSLIMLFEGALYSISQMLKAQGIEVKEIGDRAEFQVPGFEPNVVPGPNWWMGKHFVVRVKLMPKRKDKKSGKEYDEKAEVKGFMSAKDWDPSKSPKKSAEGGTGAPANKVSLLS